MDDMEDRVQSMLGVLWHWLPVRWQRGDDWFEVSAVVTPEGLDVMTSKNGADSIAVPFSEAELIGDQLMNPASARERIEAV